jgi:alanine racemase
MCSVYSARPAWVEINLDHLAHNIVQFRQLVAPQTRIMAVVKADGYGHGALMIGKTALASGAESLAVAFVEEGIYLRQSGIDAPILLLGYTDPVQFTTLISYNLTPTVFDLPTAVEFSKQAQAAGVVLPLHLKLDTGMGRVGLLPAEAVAVTEQIAALPALEIEGIFTHLAVAEDEDRSYTEEQLRKFNQIIETMKAKGISFPLIHAANSAAAINNPDAHYNLIRLGLALYGHYPATTLRKCGISLKPALTFKSRVVLVKSLPPGSCISYGCTYQTANEELIATVPVGYADGYSRLLSNQGEVLIRGVRAPVVGRICMDHLMVNVSHIPGVHRGDEVVLYGRQGAEEMAVEEVADKIGTVNYELLCAVDKRVSRFYYRNNRLVAIHDFIEDQTFDH